MQASNNPAWMGPPASTARDHLDHGFGDAPINGPGPDALVEGVGFNRSPVLGSINALTSAPNPCPACYTGEYGVAHSYTSACKESE